MKYLVFTETQYQKRIGDCFRIVGFEPSAKFAFLGKNMLGGFMQVVSGILRRIESQLPDCLAVGISHWPYFGILAQYEIEYVTL